MIAAKIQCPEKRHLCSLLRRLVPLLGNKDKALLVEKFPPKTHTALWREIGLLSLAENTRTNSVRDLASVATDSIAKFLGNGQVTPVVRWNCCGCLSLNLKSCLSYFLFFQMKGLEAALPALEADPRSISASSLFSIWNKIPSDKDALSPWLSTAEIRDSVSCWLTDFLSVLCEATSLLILNMTNQQILLVSLF